MIIQHGLVQRKARHHTIWGHAMYPSGWGCMYTPGRYLLRHGLAGEGQPRWLTIDGCIGSHRVVVVHGHVLEQPHPGWHGHPDPGMVHVRIHQGCW